MELLKAIIDYFTAYGVPVTYGTNGFVDIVPDSVDNVVAVIEYSGKPAIPWTTTATHAIQISARNLSAKLARTLADQLYAALDTGNETIMLNASTWCIVDIKQKPFRISVDTKNRITYGFNIEITAQ